MSNNQIRPTFRMQVETASAFRSVAGRRSAVVTSTTAQAASSRTWFEKSWRGSSQRALPVANSTQDSKAATELTIRTLPPTRDSATRHEPAADSRPVAERSIEGIGDRSARTGAEGPDSRGESMAQARLRAELDSMCRLRLARYRTAS